MGLRTRVGKAFQALFGLETVNMKKRSYASASSGRLLAGWMANNTSADAEIKGSLPKLQQRSRQVVRDTPYGKQAVRTIVGNVIGHTGIKMQSQIKKERYGKGLDTERNEMVEELWHDWGRYDSCHTAGRLCWTDIEKLCCSSLIESGEVFIRIVNKKFGRSKVPFALEILESDRLDNDYNGVTNNPNVNWRMGISHDEWHRPISYAFFTQHPGDSAFPTKKKQARHMILPASEVIHLYLTDRPEQTRGVPWLAPVLKQLHHLDGYAESSVIKARGASALMAFISSPEGELNDGGEIFEGDRVSEWSPGAFHYLEPGQNVTVPNFDAPNGEFEPFMRACLRGMAAGIGISYESISKDFSQSNYSSSRLSMLEDRTQYKSLQQFFIKGLHQRIFEQWLDMAVLSGALNLPGYETKPDKYKKVKWQARGFEFVDPQKEVASAKEAIKAGFKTQAQVIAEQGGDIDELMTARKTEIDMAESLGLLFDTDVATEQKQANIEATTTSESNGGTT